MKETVNITGMKAEIKSLTAENDNLREQLSLAVMPPSGDYTDKDGNEALKRVMWYVGHTNNGVNRYIAEAVSEKLCREAAMGIVEIPTKPAKSGCYCVPFPFEAEAAMGGEGK